MTTAEYRTIYIEGSHWIRMVNIVIWSMAAIILPIATSCIGIALGHPEHRVVLAIGSLCLVLVWVFLSRAYGRTAEETRKVLMNIEKEWNVPCDTSVYRTMHLPGMQKFGLRQVQVVVFIVFLAAWVYVWFGR